jgi:hypothetical protein
MVNYPKKGVFRIHDLTSIICTIILVIYHVDIFILHATVFGSLFPILRDLDSRLGGCGVPGIDYLFFSNLFEKVSKEERFKTNTTLSLIL